MLKTVKHHPLLTFYILTFVAAWGLKIPVTLSATNNIVLRLAPSFLPALAALLVIAVIAGKRGATDLLKMAGRWRVSLIWYLVALVGPMLLQLLSVVCATLLGNAFPTIDFPGIRFLPTVIIATFFALGEELGWRGFALPRLQSRFNALTSSLVVGLLWWLWHLPEVLAGPASGLSLLQCVNLEFWSLVQMLALSVLMTWLFNSTGASVLLATLLHVGSGLLGQILTIPAGSMASILFNVLLCVAAVIVVLLTGLNSPARKDQKVHKVDLPSSMNTLTFQ